MIEINMKIGTIITRIIVLISICVMPVIAAPNITTIEGLDEVKYQYNGFSVNDTWTVKLYQGSILKYDFSGTIDQIDIQSPWYVWLSERGNTGNGIRLCVEAGNYSTVTTGTHGSTTITEDDHISISEKYVYSPLIPPIPELSPIILTSTEILGLVLISIRYTK